MSGFREPDLARARTVPIGSRPGLVDRATLAKAPGPDRSFHAFLDSLPHSLAADHIRQVARAVTNAHRAGRAVVALTGGHVIKVGLGPLLADWVSRGLLTHVALNGAAAIHDFELAAYGSTSEDVERGLADGSFGMAAETGVDMNRAIVRAHSAGLGLGEGLADALASGAGGDRERHSVMLACHHHRVPLTVHTVIGAETIHQHPTADGAAIGGTALRDFRRLVGSLAGLDEGGVVLNFGSAVVMPEVFLKALSVARNLGQGRPAGFLAADFDMTRHYRPRVNVVERPTRAGGTGIMLTGHHEIMIPLLVWAVDDALAAD